jgi:hypothetical protein
MILSSRRNPNDRISDLLELSPNQELDPQALKKGGQRYARRFAIEAKKSETHLPDPQEKPEILVVDDFLTSGSTLRSAIAATRDAFTTLGREDLARAKIGIFVLGFRPALFGERESVGETSPIIR